MATRIPQNAPSFVQLQGFLGSFLLNCNSRPWRPGILNCSWWKLWLFNHLFLWLVMAGGSFFLFFSFEVEHRCFIPTKGCSVSTMITISDWSPSLASSASGEKIASEDLGHHGGASFHARQMSRCLWYSYLELVWILNFGTCLICLVLKQALTKLSRNYPWTVLKPWLEPSVEDQSSWLTALGLVLWYHASGEHSYLWNTIIVKQSSLGLTFRNIKMDAPKYFSLASSSQHILYSSKQQNMPLGETLRTSFFEESRATSFLIPESILQVVQNND